VSDRPEREDPVIADIRKSKAVSLKVEQADGAVRAVAVGATRNRWAKLSKLLGAMSWVRIECLDKDGAVLGIVEADDDEDLDDEDSGGGDVKAMTRIMLEVMRTTMKEVRCMFDVQTRAQSELVNSMVEGLRAVQDSYSLAMRVQAANMALPADQGADGEMMKLLQMGLMLKQSGPAHTTPKVVKP
jgi:hypothetical protein